MIETPMMMAGNMPGRPATRQRTRGACSGPRKWASFAEGMQQSYEGAPGPETAARERWASRRGVGETVLEQPSVGRAPSRGSGAFARGASTSQTLNHRSTFFHTSAFAALPLRFPSQLAHGLCHPCAIDTTGYWHAHVHAAALHTLSPMCLSSEPLGTTVASPCPEGVSIGPADTHYRQ